MKAFPTRTVARLAPVMLIALLLGGCESAKNALGINKTSPDESRVSVYSPLVVPPDFQLRPPGSGGVEVQGTRNTARQVTSVAIGPDGRIVTTVSGGGGPENSSTGELAVLRQAGALSPPEGIRELAVAQEESLRRLNQLLTDLILFGEKDPNARVPDPRERTRIETVGLF
ncbi:MAG: DUF3035 domain-containing protein [Pseudomonadota bacterium]|nr:DUF3035 domain-containing protein [Pseudomonadota bacterium]